MSIESLELEALFTELRQLANDAGAGSLAKTASEASEGEGEAALERRVAQLVLLSTALRAGIEAC